MKRQILSSFIQEQESQPIQGSLEWHASRSKTIGGSEIGKIVYPTNVFTKGSNIPDLLFTKVGLSEFKGNIHTSWGSLLEHFAIIYFQLLFNTVIFNTGSIKNVVPGIAYSPDGLCYIDIAGLIILIEIKCPTIRIPNGKVPDNYLSQIYTGLQVIKICDAAVFVDCAFRRCCLQDFVFNNVHDNVLHKYYNYNEDEIKLCLVGFYSDFNEEKEIDLGSVSIEKLESVLNNKKLQVYYSEIITKDTENNLILDYTNFLLEKKSVAILPLKLMKVDLTVVNRYDWNDGKQGEEFLDKYKEIIHNIIELITSLNKLSREDKITTIENNKLDYIRIFKL